tara:strand:+ start:288 stop:1577 length:1290 start_codon:yes stop_codon:yes gene_type:complete
MVHKLRISSLIFIHILILLHVYYFGSETIGSIDFQEFFHSFIKLGVINAGGLLVIFAFLFTLIFGRFFCGWACHFGAIQEFSWYILKKLNINPQTIDSKLVTILPFIILLNFYLIPNIYYAYQNDWSLSIAMNEPEIWEFLPGFVIGTLTFFIDGFLIVYFLGKKGFCRFICPWGAFLKIPTSLALFKVRKTGECTHCHVCTSECPIGIDVSYEINTFDKVVNSNCTSCMNCTSGCPSNALSYKFSNPLNEEYRLNQFLTKNNAYTHSNISKTFKKIRKSDYYLLGLTLLLGFSIDSLYGMGHFMAYGIGLIISYIILEYSKKYSKPSRLLLTVLFISIFIWHGTVKYSIWNGIKLYNQGDYNSSISNLERVVNLYPKKIGRFHIILSEMYLDSNRFEDALEHAVIAKEINPEHIAPKQLIEIINSKRN